MRVRRMSATQLATKPTHFEPLLPIHTERKSKERRSEQIKNVVVVKEKDEQGLLLLNVTGVPFGGHLDTQCTKTMSDVHQNASLLHNWVTTDFKEKALAYFSSSLAVKTLKRTLIVQADSSSR